MSRVGLRFWVVVSRTSLAEYEPILKEVEKILAEAGLDEDEMKMQGTRDVAQGVGAGSRNRR